MVQNCTTSSSLQSLVEQSINLNQITAEIEQIEINHQLNELQLNTDDVQDMGQNLSLRRPRISLTWVLREQQQNLDVNKISSPEHNRPKHLFNENFVKNEKDSKIDRYSPIDNKRNKQITELKTTYSEPSLNTAVDTVPRRHRHRKRKERSRSQKFGYEIRNVDDFLSKCSLSTPANIPVVLSSPTTLYQTRSGGYQIEMSLPLGMVVNAVFKNQNWLYVQTPHAVEGYVGYNSCLPLGILPPNK